MGIDSISAADELGEQPELSSVVSVADGTVVGNIREQLAIADCEQWTVVNSERTSNKNQKQNN